MADLVMEYAWINGPLLALLEERLPRVVCDGLSRLRYLSTRVCNAVLEFDAARELFEDNPALLWLLVRKSSFDCDVKDKLGEILLKTRREILNLAAGVGEWSAVKFLAKVDIGYGTKAEMDLIYESVQDKNILYACRHLNHVGIGLLHAMKKMPELKLEYISNFVRANQEMNMYESYGVLAGFEGLHGDIVRAAKMLGIENYENVLSRCSSIEDFNRIHDKWVSRINEEMIEAEMKKMGEFPSPPIPNSDDIVYIESPYELYREGVEMDHCVATYIPEALHGDVFFYKVMKPERATVAVEMVVDEYEIRELSMKRNREPDNETHRHVEEWVSSAN
jgi:hypothetical protein